MFVTDVLFGNGGAERNIHLLASGLRARGHKVIVCCLRGGGLSAQMRAEGFRVEEIGTGRMCGSRGLKSVLKLLGLARTEKVSVIVSYHESSDYIGLLTAFLAGVPIVSSRRDMGYRLREKHIFLYRLLNRFFDRITAVSSAVKQHIVKSQWARPSRVEVIYNGVELLSDKATPPGCAGIPDSTPLGRGALRIFYVANFRPIKGHSHLVEAAKLVVQRFPNVRFVFIGTWLQTEGRKCYDQVRKQVKDLGLEHVVDFAGETQPCLLHSLLSRMDISVLPSLSEGMSNTLLESMAAGIPAVATSVGGTPEVVRHAETGYLVPPGDPSSMAEAVLRLLSDPNLRRDMGRRARSRVEAGFSVARMVERYEDLFQYLFLKRKLGACRRFRRWLARAIRRTTSWAKVFAALIVHYTGLVRVFRAIKSLLHIGTVKILCFHDVSELAERHPQFNISITPASFARVLDFLAQDYRVVSLEEAVRLLGKEHRLATDVFALTFDDCYKGWVNHVLPACQHFRIPYTVFLNTHCLESGNPLLYESLIFLTENTWRRVADLSRWQLGVFLIDSPSRTHSFVEEVHRFWRGKSREECNHFLQGLSDYFGVPLYSENFREMSLNWHDVRKMDLCGVTIGAHTVDHISLRHLPENECFQQVYESKGILEDKLRHSIDFFAYPFGGRDSYSSDTLRIVKKAGFRNAFTLESWNGGHFEPFEIGRRCVHRGMFLRPDGRFHTPLLATELSGLGDLICGRVFRRRRGSGILTHD